MPSPLTVQDMVYSRNPPSTAFDIFPDGTWFEIKNINKGYVTYLVLLTHCLSMEPKCSFVGIQTTLVIQVSIENLVVPAYK